MERLPKNTLVRFRCMVQDPQMGQELFVAAYKRPNDGRIITTGYTEDLRDTEVRFLLFYNYLNIKKKLLNN